MQALAEHGCRADSRVSDTSAQGIPVRNHPFGTIRPEPSVSTIAYHESERYGND